MKLYYFYVQKGGSDTNSLIDNYTKEELDKIVKNSKSYRSVLKKIGYKTVNGRNNETLKKRINKYNISTEHFEHEERIERTFENVFCVNSTARQSTLRTWYKRISDDSYCSICNQPQIWNNKLLTMILDHVNGDNHDNRLENLRWICPNCNSQLPTFAGRNNNTRKKYTPVIKRKKNRRICPICNINEISVASKMCLECRNKEKSKNIPPKEELEELIYKESFVSIGNRFGVSDNAVRKWCKKYGLPFRYGELHKYSA